MKVFFSPEPVIFADQGGMPDYAPNTLECFEESFKAGADVIGLNVQLSADREVFVIPELKLDNISNGSGPVINYSSGELKKLDAAFNFRDSEGE